MRSISTFELLIKPLIPPQFDGLDAGRTVIQGYFLTISNLSDEQASINIKLIAKTPPLESDPEKFIAFLDTGGQDQKLSLPGAVNDTTTLLIGIPPRDTGLLIVQPFPSKESIENPTTEVRGFVSIEIDKDSKIMNPDLLLTPEHRGTFLPKNFKFEDVGKGKDIDFDQLVYTLPLAEGKALYSF